MGRYEVVRSTYTWDVKQRNAPIWVACFWGASLDCFAVCPNAEREARALCRRLNVAAKKPKPKPKKKGKVKR